jgi:FkbM family methyltransferase
MSQFVNTLVQIAHSESVGVLPGIGRHLQWQLRKLFGRFPCELKLGSSSLVVDRPGGVAALVNAMGQYDYNNMSLLRLLLADGGTFIDVGANIGSYALIASENTRAQVISVEPHPKTFALLERNVARNGRHNVKCLNIALSSYDGEADLTDDLEPSLNRIVPDGECAGQSLRVTTRRFDALFKELGVEPDFVKIDVEGHEIGVLNGIGDMAAGIKLFFVERWEQKELKEWMRRESYEGPFFVNYRGRTLASRAQKRPEDAVFMNHLTTLALARKGFAISASPLCADVNDERNRSGRVSRE